jgi:hypothetical protein
MKLRILAVCALAAGLVLSLALAVLAQRAEVKGVNQAIPDIVSAGPAVSVTALREPTSPDYVPQIAFTPAFTIYLSAVPRNHTYRATTPTLISPADGSNLDTLIPLFTWDSGNDPDATELYLEIWRDSELTDWVTGLQSLHRTQGTHQWRINLNLDPATTYYWRAYLMCGGTQGPSSDLWSFTTGSGGTVLPGPTLLSPPNGSILPSPGPATREVTLKWSSVNGAVQYRVNLTSGEGYYTSVVTGTETTLRLNWNTHYEWWVQARNDYAWGTESAHWRFTTPVYAPTPTRPPPTTPGR